MTIPSPKPGRKAFWRRWNTLYLRLALVLSVALLAGFGTMYWMFHQHVESNRGPGHGLEVQIRLVEALLQAQPDANVTALTGLQIYRGEAPPDTRELAQNAGSPGSPREPALGPPPLGGPPGLLGPGSPVERLARALKRPIKLRTSNAPPGESDYGVWLRLEVPQAAWLFLADPHRPRGIEPWTLGMFVAFGVVLVGGMVFLWRMQIPLRRLAQALREIGPRGVPNRLALHGPREVEELAEQFNSMVERLQRHEDDRQVMLAGVAHDLRAPVTRLRLQAERVARPLEDGRDLAQRMNVNLDSIELIIDQFLFFAHGGVSEAFAEFDLDAFAAEVTAPYETRGVVYLPLAGEAPVLPIKPASLRRALTNLIENALEYGAPPVEVLLEPHADRVDLIVRDGGPGIPAEALEKALRPFTRLDSSRSTHGHCGLGLAIVDKVSQSHQGQLHLETAPRGGLQVRLTLPLLTGPNP